MKQNSSNLLFLNNFLLSQFQIDLSTLLYTGSTIFISILNVNEVSKISNEIEFTDKKQAVSKLSELFTLWTNYLSPLTTEQATTISFHANRTIKDDIAHLYIWQKVSVARFEAALNNSSPNFDFWSNDFDMESDEHLNSINEWIYTSNANKSWSEIFQAWKDNFQHLLTLAEKFDQETLLKSAKYSWLDGYPLIAVLSGTYNHHKGHLDKVLTH